MRQIAISVLALVAGWVASAGAQEKSSALNLSLPTENDALFHGGGAAFYQYIIRDFKGVKSMEPD